MLKMYIIVILLFCLVAPIIWGTVVYAISFTSGWQSLAKTYASDNFPENAKSCSGVFNSLSNYSGTLEYAENSNGLFLKTSTFFKIGHHPLFIPWSDIQDFKQSGSLFAENAITFKIKGINCKLYTDTSFIFYNVNH